VTKEGKPSKTGKRTSDKKKGEGFNEGVKIGAAPTAETECIQEEMKVPSTRTLLKNRPPFELFEGMENLALSEI